MTPYLAVLSMFHNAEKYLPHYLGQCALFEYEYGWNVEYFWMHGNCTDLTEEELYATSLNANVIEHNVSQVYGSVEEPARFRQLSEMWNKLLDEIDEPDYVAIIESDLTWYPWTLGTLLDEVKQYNTDIACPTVLRASDGVFWDTWAYRKDGIRFSPYKPHYDGYDGKTPTELDSAGSFLVMRGNVAAEIRCTPEEELVGFCRNAKEAGYRVTYYPERIVYHPG